MKFRRLLMIAMTALVSVASCGGGDAVDESEYRRHLRLGVEALRRDLVGSARAELERCAEARPEDPEQVFHRGRLALLQGEAPRAALLFEQAVALDPGHVGAHRALLLIAAGRGDTTTATAHRRAIEAAYGPVGGIDLDRVLQFERSGSSGPLVFPPPGSFVSKVRPYQDLNQGFSALRRAGNYDAEAGVRLIEAVLEAHPDLPALRYHYARILDQGQVRIVTTDDPTLPPISSKVTLDLALKHLEDAYDRLPPDTHLATAVHRSLSNIAMQMAEYEESFLFKSLALKDSRLAPADRAALQARQGLARYKQGRLGEARALLSEVAQASLVHAWLLYLVERDLGVAPQERSFGVRGRQSEPGEAPDFVDVAAALGVDKLDGLGPSAWADVDRDGDHDLFVCGCDSYGVLLRDDGEVFVDASREVGLENVQSGYSATLADSDGDGWPDLYIGRDGWNGPAANSLYRNQEGRFEDVTAAAGVGDEGSSFVHVWTDVDRDGDIDLYLANGITGGGDINTLYRNGGDGTFEDATRIAGLREQRGTKTIGVAVGDYDLDGWPDLFCSGYQTTNRLYHNEGDGRYREVAEEAGVLGADHVSTGYVAFFLDVDNDLDLDILRTSLAPWESVLRGLSADVEVRVPRGGPEDGPKLYRNVGGGRFIHASGEAGLVQPIGIMGAGVADLDNDGWIDLYLGTGDPDVGRLEPDRYLHNAGGGRFEDWTFATGLGNLGKGHGVTFIDRDGDGDLDIYAPEGGFVHGDPWRNAFYENRGHAGANHWLHVELEGVESNRDAIDARVVVTTELRSQVREVNNGEGFGSTSSRALEFGLGAEELVERLEVRWPSGRVQAFDDVPVDVRLFIREGEGWSQR